MSLLRWFTRKPPVTPGAPPTAASRAPAERPPSPELQGKTGAAPGTRKGERAARRELLYAVVRDSMTRAGVLAASYKFKVLSLDGRGRQFLVMIDHGGQQGDGPLQPAAIETMIVEAAKARHAIEVAGVYWRLERQVAPRPSQADATAATVAVAAISAASATLTVASTSAKVVVPRVNPFEPIDDNEVAAFKQALALGLARPTAPVHDGGYIKGPSNYTLLTGFEDTELPPVRSPALSKSQYGDLN